ncbi:hypothetical protein RHSIM_Rhsim13G0158500 [Rhododendron simsii]|uniref:Gnk2-homologous domain-containing protein n=1 Tax=Rhododendron simsii TaxID=118357 RepID=A0A834G0Z3_RHOSS|nr:hypothetical protein RHSIM_Rhsim13G0158500 [Rhododendron simsii]
MANLPHKMPRKALFVHSICLLSFIPIIEGADPTFSYIECPDTTLSTTSTYAPNSTYQTNLNTLLSVLSSNSNNASNGFYSFTAGRSPPNIAHGLFLCRGDISPAVCQDCVVYASRDIVRRCPWSKRAKIWYDECMLRYSNASLTPSVSFDSDEDRGGAISNLQNVTNASRLHEVLGEVMRSIASDWIVRGDRPGMKNFVTAQANYSQLLTVYGLGQCILDMSGPFCQSCLSNCIARFPKCCDAKVGGRVLLGSCNVRYEMYAFYNVSAGNPLPPSPAVPPPTPPPSTTTTSGIAPLPPSPSLELSSNLRYNDIICHYYGISFTRSSMGLVLSVSVVLKYAMEGLFSVKSDVFSFGVLLLEIISGKRNSGFYLSEHGQSLLTYAWNLWCKDEGVLDLMDPLLVDSCVATEVLKCIHLGLLCVQEDPADRPTMSTIVITLGSNSVTLSQPTQPAFSVGRSVLKPCQASPNDNLVSVNEMTISDVSAR